MNEFNLLSRLHTLLSASLPLWDVQGDVSIDPSAGHIKLSRSDGLHLSISETSPEMRDIVRWSISRANGSSRVCSSVLGVLTAVKEELGASQSRSLPLRLGVMGVSS